MHLKNSKSPSALQGSPPWCMTSTSTCRKKIIEKKQNHKITIIEFEKFTIRTKSSDAVLYRLKFLSLRGKSCSDSSYPLFHPSYFPFSPIIPLYPFLHYSPFFPHHSSSLIHLIFIPLQIHHTTSPRPMCHLGVPPGSWMSGGCKWHYRRVVCREAVVFHVGGHPRKAGATLCQRL